MNREDLAGKKLLILGSDYGTYDIACQAKAMGLYVICADTMATSPTKEACDEAWRISTTDHDQLIALMEDRQVDGIIAGASEFNLEQTRIIARRLGLAVWCPSDEAWALARNKRKFKDLCQRHGVSVALDYVVTADSSQEELDAIEYPVVVKPVDSSGNRGQSFCDNQEELLAALDYAKSVSASGQVIVERRLHGPEFSGYYIMAGGHARFLMYTQDFHQPGVKSNIYSIKTTTCAHLHRYLEDIDASMPEVLADGGFTDGIAFVDCMLDEDGHFYVLEMGFRMGGPVLYRMHDRISGFNTIQWLIEIALGVRHTEADLPEELLAYRQVATSYNLFTNQAGTIQRFQGLDLVQSLDNVILDMPKRAGAFVRDHANSGVVRILGDDEQRVIDTLRFINDHLRMENAQGDNMFIRFTEYDSLLAQYHLGLQEFGLCQD